MFVLVMFVLVMFVFVFALLVVAGVEDKGRAGHERLLPLSAACHCSRKKSQPKIAVALSAAVCDRNTHSGRRVSRGGMGESRTGTGRALGDDFGGNVVFWRERAPSAGGR